MPTNTSRRVARGEANGDIRALQELVAELGARLADQEGRLAAQQEEIARLRAERAEVPTAPLIQPSVAGRRRAGDAGRGTAPG